MERPRLTSRLDALAEGSTGSQVFLVSAPAGFGKTTAVCMWAEARMHRGAVVAWCSLTSLDSTPFRFWSLVLAGLESAGGDRAHAVRELSAPHESQDEDFVAALVEALEGFGPLLLVLDNLHEVADPGLMRAVDGLLSRLPTSVKVVLISRADPPLGMLQRLKLSRRLGQLRAADLAFTAEETAAVSPDLDGRTQRLTWERTEGWPALVRLMGLAVGASREVGSYSTERDGALADYLFHELFDRQAPRVQHALMVCAVPDLVPLDLAVQLSGLPDAGWILEDVARRSGLITQGGHKDPRQAWYRFHPILRAYLRGELLRRDSDLEREMHLRAGAWLLAHDYPAEAVWHGALSGDVAFQERVVASTGARLVNSGEARLLLSRLQPALRQRTDLTWTRIVSAAALLDVGRVQEASSLLDARPAPEALLDQPALGAAWQAVEVHLRRRQGVEPSRELSEPVTVDDPDVRLLLAVQRGPALLWQGQVDAAEREAVDAAELARGLGRSAALIDCLVLRAAVCSASGDFAGVRQYAAEALELTEAHGFTASPRAVPAHVLAGWADRQGLDDASSRRHAERAFGLLEPSVDPSTALAARALHAAIRAEEAPYDRREAERLHAIWVTTAEATVEPALLAFAALADTRANLRLHRRDRVEETRRSLVERLGRCAESLVVAALLEQASGRPGRAEDLLVDVVQGRVDSVSPLTVAEAAALAAGLVADRGDIFGAVALARRAVSRALEMQALRPLADAGPSFRRLLASERGRWGAHEHVVHRLVAREPAEPASTPPGPTVLTERELDILQELPTLRTLADIADSLFVSVNTVKTHLRSVYRKLGVASRREAVATARRTGLL